ncbi:glycosyl hydrolase family 65 protein [Actinoallomurus sp. NPDC052274]|uniref:glycosyl hydrolase family 65 protein n=1 Tax=Actinoallomurus sp. NPDC052274 TaxID=3155420 RepID=UPI0034469494
MPLPQRNRRRRVGPVPTQEDHHQPLPPAAVAGRRHHGVEWHGRVFDLSVGQRATKLTVRSGPPLPVRVAGSGVREVTPGAALQAPTRHPAGDAKQCS